VLGANSTGHGRGACGAGEAAPFPATHRERVPVPAREAALPGLLIAVIIAARPPQPARLRTVGWTLVAASILTGVIVVAAV
jgi:hypothetical protein